MIGRVLVVNSSYLPIALIDWMRAVCLLFQNKAEVVVAGTHVVRSPSTEFVVPEVLRLRTSAYPSKRRIRLSRKNVMIRDKHTCQYCGKKLPASQLNLDHVIPRSRGGETKWTNIVACCLEHNARKGNKTPKEAGLRLLRDPLPPNWCLGQEIVENLASGTIPEAWAGFLPKSK